MAKVLVCTGKKKKVAAVFDFYVKMEKSGKLEILAKKLQTKKALFWGYDELKILFEVEEGAGDFALPKETRKGIDLFSVRDQAQVVVEFSSFLVEDTMLRARILTLSRPFVARQVKVKISEQIHKHSEYRIERRCTGQIIGPVKEVFTYKEQLMKEKLCDPKSLTYVF